MTANPLRQEVGQPIVLCVGDDAQICKTMYTLKVSLR
jgi:hypothetical protein